MRDIPMFTTENGAAGLVLREIPYTAAAYIRIHCAGDGQAMAEECAAFCRAAGAERIYAMGQGLEQWYPLHTAILKMQCPRDGMAETDGRLFPVTPETAEHWREIYNRRMAAVPNAAWMTMDDGKAMAKKGDGYFIHRDGLLLGIGRAAEDTIHTLASVQPGAGETVVRALASLLTGDTVSLEVASANQKAIALYARLGFAPVRELSRWYRIWEKSDC